MAFLGQEIKQDELPESSAFDPLPEGWYTATITQADLKNTKLNTGQYISVRYDITGPSFQGRVVYSNINIRNQTQKAEEIGRQQLGALMRAIGLAKLSDTDELINKDVSIKLSIKTDDYGTKNEVKGFKAVEGSIPPVHSNEAPAEVSKSVPPWAKK